MPPCNSNALAADREIVHAVPNNLGVFKPITLNPRVAVDHVNLASRLADKAKAGQILIAERTLVAVREFVNATELDEIELKGGLKTYKDI